MPMPDDRDPLHAAVHAKLAAIAAASAAPPPWSAAWARLGPRPTDEQRLAVYRAVRDAGALPDDAGFYLVAWQIDAVTLPYAEQALRDLEERLRAIERAHGLGEDDCWPAGEGPPEYREVQRQLHEAWDALYTAKLEELGEPAMARLYSDDREEFERRSAAGRQFFHRPDAEADFDDTAWLDDLLEAVAGCAEAGSPMGPLGLRHREEEGFWEVWIYPTPVELVGGAHDGAVVAPDFCLDLERLRSTFEVVADFGWNALGLHCPEGPYVHVEGVYRGREVYLQVLAQAPHDEEPGLKLDATRRPPQPD